MKKREMEQEITRLQCELTAFKKVFFEEVGEIEKLIAFKKVFCDELKDLVDMRKAIYDELKEIDDLKKAFAAQVINGRDKQADCNDDGNGERKR